MGTLKDQEPVMPTDLREALAANCQAETAWNDLTVIGRRDFVRWIGEAKQAETRNRRIQICCDKLLKGQRRPCCYAIPPIDMYKALWDSPAAKAQWSALTAVEKRDLCDWLEESEDKPMRKGRIAEACAFLAAGKRGP